MPTDASKCRTPYTSHCVGNAKALHEQDSPSPAIFGHADLAHCDMEPSE